VAVPERQVCLHLGQTMEGPIDLGEGVKPWEGFGGVPNRDGGQ
jgi:hypothetical protein